MKVNAFLRGNILETGTLLKRVEETTKLANLRIAAEKYQIMTWTLR